MSWIIYLVFSYVPRCEWLPKHIICLQPKPKNKYVKCHTYIVWSSKCEPIHVSQIILLSETNMLFSILTTFTIYYMLFIQSYGKILGHRIIPQARLPSAIRGITIWFFSCESNSSATLYTRWFVLPSPFIKAGYFRRHSHINGLLHSD